MKICEIVPSLEERHGGPSKSVAALARALAGLGQDVSLLATDPVAPAERTEGALHVRVFQRNWPGGFCPSRGLREHLRRTAVDVVHHHSIWLRTLHYAHQHAAAAAVPLVISPRGMMSTWAWNYHAWRKQFARTFVHRGAFEAAAGWHATSSEEAAEIRALGFTQPVCLAPNGVTTPTPEDVARAAAYWRETCPAVTRHPTALFYSRFHQKKRVLELIDLWLEHAPANWLLLMVGLPDDYTPAQLETYIMRSSGGGRIHVFDGEGRPAPYAVASLFLLPSHNENFGLVVAEAMAHGVPVLVTDTTPWSMVNRTQTGWCVPWSAFPAALPAALEEGTLKLSQRGAAAREQVLAEFSWERSARLLLDFYRELGATPRPS